MVRLQELSVTTAFVHYGADIVIRILPDSFGYRWGSTEEERAASYPCDRHLSNPDDVLFRALTVQRSRSDVFRWLCQLRVAPYSYDWIDNRGHRSPRELIPGLEKLATGQRVMKIFELVAFEPNMHITLVIDDPGAHRLFGKIVCSYIVNATLPSETRLVVKLLARRTTHRRFAWMGPLLPWGDLIMMRKQLLTLKTLCEGPL